MSRNLTLNKIVRLTTEEINNILHQDKIPFKYHSNIKKKFELISSNANNNYNNSNSHFEILFEKFKQDCKIFEPQNKNKHIATLIWLHGRNEKGNNSHLWIENIKYHSFRKY